MAVHAHPDDESSKGAATMARYAAEGAEVLVVTCTGGERGSIINPTYPQPHPTPEVMAIVRRQEMAAAAGALGVRQHWQPLKLYYNHDFSLRKLTAIHHAMIQAGLASPYGDWLASRQMREIPERDVTTRVHVAPWFAARDAALRAYATQVDPGGFFFAVPRDLEARVWPVEEYELAHSHVPVALPEDDLFAGRATGTWECASSYSSTGHTRASRSRGTAKKNPSGSTWVACARSAASRAANQGTACTRVVTSRSGISRICREASQSPYGDASPASTIAWWIAVSFRSEKSWL